ncbi:MAG: hypothetical protein OEW16_11175, partial [Gammaproteobacteria bacterium]|nr:hypothetical protein [Gammaproteobacteria bacterium]
MSIKNCLRRLVCAVAPILLLAGCSAPPDPEPPVGQLGTAVVPTRYGIELAIDPSKDRFTGTAVIDVTLSEPQDAIWLHG